MAIGKQFDEEMGYAASRELPAAVAQYMKATGKSEEQVAQEIINEDPEWLDWTTHTKHPGNSTPEDNGWTDLKKLGLGIANSWEDHRNNTDPMWRVGLVNAMFGDPSMLGQYYQMQNANEQAELSRKQQQEYNDYWRRVELAAEQKEKDAIAAKEALEQNKIKAAERKEAIDIADNLEAEIMDMSGQGFDFTGISEVQKNKFKKAIEKVAEKDGDTSKYEVVARALGLLKDEGEPVETPVDEEPVVETKPAKNENEPKVNLTELKTERNNIVSIRPTDVSWDNRDAVAAYNKKAKLFNAKLNQSRVASSNIERLSLITPPVNPATVKLRDKRIQDALEEQDEANKIAGIHDKIASGSGITSDEWNKVKSNYDRKSPSAYNELSEDEKKKYKKAGPWYYKKK